MPDSLWLCVKRRARSPSWHRRSWSPPAAWGWNVAWLCPTGGSAWRGGKALSHGTPLAPVHPPLDRHRHVLSGQKQGGSRPRGSQAIKVLGESRQQRPLLLLPEARSLLRLLHRMGSPTHPPTTLCLQPKPPLLPCSCHLSNACGFRASPLLMPRYPAHLRVNQRTLVRCWVHRLGSRGPDSGQSDGFLRIPSSARGLLPPPRELCPHL